jgi:hypothetical protein
MVPLPVVVRHELVEGAEEPTLPDEDQVSSAGEFPLSFAKTPPAAPSG